MLWCVLAQSKQMVGCLDFIEIKSPGTWGLNRKQDNFVKTYTDECDPDKAKKIQVTCQFSFPLQHKL